MDILPEVLYLKIAGYLDSKSICNYCNSSKSINRQRLYRLVYNSKLKCAYGDVFLMKDIYEGETLSSFLRDINCIFFNNDDNYTKRKTVFFKNIYQNYSSQFKNILHNNTVFIDEQSDISNFNRMLHIMYRLSPLDVNYLKRTNNRLILALIY